MNGIDTGDGRRAGSDGAPPPPAGASTPEAAPARTPVPSAAGGLDTQLRQAVTRTARMRAVFYVVVLLVALAGQVTGATQKLDIPLLVAIPAVATLELGGVVVMANADVRRRLGERALASRILSAAVAAAAVAFNWLSHDNPLVGGFFAGMSALGYLVWLTHVENLRRDRLRAVGALPATTPAYEILGHWLRHPRITRRARSLARADPRLGLYDSIDAARTQLRREHRDRAIATVLRRKIRTAVDPRTATIAVHVYDLDEIAARLAATADYDGLTNLIAADLTPTRIATSGTPHPRRRLRLPHVRPAGGDNPGSGSPDDVAQGLPLAIRPGSTATNPRRGRHRSAEATDPDRPRPPAKRDTGQMGRQRDHTLDESRPATDLLEPAPPPAVTARTEGDGDAGRPPTTGDRGQASPVLSKTAAAVAYWLRIDATLPYQEIGRRIGRTERTVRRNLPPDFHRPAARGEA
ncbi:hypothetical protein [Micromonospora yangpuensis]|uniref:Uncharacterized protein n=1 Tax=Micromonospora yangpuensis TaxID=683228 RepID=A0A1C6U489_9ACTN|nr:hypothetical protein [Micromonospora yangpuensis]GGL92903.1 hypothetical protein GCM10012279_08200 [Micromonospora yangpuensis]SCL48847.1 Protein of unknown function [Micromonospora yangpuensis]